MGSLVSLEPLQYLLQPEEVAGKPGVGETFCFSACSGLAALARLMGMDGAEKKLFKVRCIEIGMVADLPPCSFSFVATGHSQGCRQALYSRPRSEAHRLNGVWQQLVDPGGRCRALCEKCEFFALRSLHPSDYRFCICWRPI